MEGRREGVGVRYLEVEIEGGVKVKVEVGVEVFGIELVVLVVMGGVVGRSDAFAKLKMSASSLPVLLPSVLVEYLSMLSLMEGLELDVEGTGDSFAVIGGKRTTAFSFSFVFVQSFDGNS